MYRNPHSRGPSPDPVGTWGQRVWTFVRTRPLGALGGAILVVMVLIAVFADAIATHDPVVQDIPNRLTPPGAKFYLGTDTFGRDVFSRIVHGARVSLFVGLVSAALGTSIGTFIGISSAYVGGKIDLVVQRLVDATMAFPTLVLALIIVAAFGASLTNVVIAVVIALMPQAVRLSMSNALSIKQETYVLAAQAMGASSLRTMLRHILPNGLAPVLVLATEYLAEAVLAEAALSFLGLGVPPPHPSWGRMLQEGAHQFLEVAPWLTIFPGLALTLAIFSFSLFGDALRDALDPRLSVRGFRRHAKPTSVEY